MCVLVLSAFINLTFNVLVQNKILDIIWSEKSTKETNRKFAVFSPQKNKNKSHRNVFNNKYATNFRISYYPLVDLIFGNETIVHHWRKNKIFAYIMQPFQNKWKKYTECVIKMKREKRVRILTQSTNPKIYLKK